MSIYRLNGAPTLEAYSCSGLSVQTAYNASGIAVFNSELPDLTVMSYNVGSWYDGSGSIVPADKDASYYALQNGILSRYTPDIFCIQEYYSTFSSTRTAESLLSPYFAYIEAMNRGSYYGRAICSKDCQLSDFETHNFTGDSNYYYAKAYTAVKGHEIAIYTTHLSTGASARASQVQELIGLLQNEEYFVACGDFNALDCINTHGEDYRSVITPLLEEGFHLANCSKFGFITTYKNENNWTGCLDNIVTSSNIEIVSVIVDTTKLNDDIEDKVDHMPLIAELRFM